MADVVIGASLQMDGNQAEQSVKSFKQQLKDASNEVINISDKFGATSKEAVIAAKKVAELRDRIGDAKDLVSAFNPDRKFQAFSSAVQGVVGGFSALTGTMALFGVESDDVQKTLLKVQAAMALSEGINSIMSARDSFKNLGSVISSTNILQKVYAASTVATTGIMRGLGIATVQTSFAFKALRTAIITTGVGALVVGLGYLIEKIISFTDNTEDAAAAQEMMKKATDRLNASLDAETAALTHGGEILKLQVKLRRGTAEEIRKIDESTSRLRLDAMKRNREDLIREGASTAEVDKQIKAEEQKRELDNLAFKVAQREKADSDIKQRSGKSGGGVDKAKEQREQEKKERIENEKQAQEELGKLINENALRRLNDRKAEIRFESEQEIQRIKGLVISEQLKAQYLAEQRRKEFDLLKEVDDENKLKLDEAKIESDAAFFDGVDAQLEAEAVLANKKIELEVQQTNKQKEESEKRKLIQQAELEAKLSFFDSVGSAIGALGNLFEKGTAMAKIAAIAEIAIGVGTGYIRGLEIAQKSAAAAGPGAAFAFPVFYATQIAAVLGAAAKAKSILATAKGGGGGVDTGGGMSTSAPLQPRLQSVSTRIDQDQVNQIGNAAVKAFIIESDVTNNQERVRRLNRAARLG